MGSVGVQQLVEYKNGISCVQWVEYKNKVTLCMFSQCQGLFWPLASYIIDFFPHYGRTTKSENGVRDKSRTTYCMTRNLCTQTVVWFLLFWKSAQGFCDIYTHHLQLYCKKLFFAFSQPLMKFTKNLVSTFTVPW